MPTLGPRLIVAGTHSGVGKTTVATGLMAVLTRRGMRVAAAKVGPDFIDPGYHALATGRPPRNLDAWICGPDAIAPLAARAGAGCDVTVIEGVMGLFDGAADRAGPVASTAQVSSLLEAPVVLVVDASAMSGSVAAVVHGYTSLDPAVRIAGIVLNRVAGDSHESMLRAALDPLGTRVFGCLRRDDALTWRDRHLGLVPVVEQAGAVRESLNRLATVIEQSCDVEALVDLARAAPQLSVDNAPRARPTGRARIAMADSAAFSFHYTDNRELLQEAGAELVPFDPAADERLPDGVTGLYAGGGFPEVFAPELGANASMLADVRGRVRAGMPTWAECGGLLWLARSLDGHGMAGVVEADGRMTARLTLGYRRARLLTESFLGPAGTEVRGHEFHYSTLDPAGDGMELSGASGERRAGFVTPSLVASYLHLHLGGAPELAERFVAAAATVRLPR